MVQVTYATLEPEALQSIAKTIADMGLSHWLQSIKPIPENEGRRAESSFVVYVNRHSYIGHRLLWKYYPAPGDVTLAIMHFDHVPATEEQKERGFDPLVPNLCFEPAHFLSEEQVKALVHGARAVLGGTVEVLYEDRGKVHVE